MKKRLMLSALLVSVLAPSIQAQEAAGTEQVFCRSKSQN